MAKKINYASMFTLRKDGRYQGSYTDETGRHYVYDRDPERLWHKLNDPKEEKPILFRDIAIAWHDSVWDTMQGGTKASYEAHYKRALERLGDRIAVEISAHDIQTQLDALKANGYAASTINKQKIIYRTIFRNAIVDPKFGKTITHNPADYTKLPSGLPKANKREAPEDEIVKQIQEKAETAYFGKFALFLLCTGFRRGEALAVKWKDVDRKAGTIRCACSISYRAGGTKERLRKLKAGSGRFRSWPRFYLPWKCRKAHCQQIIFSPVKTPESRCQKRHMTEDGCTIAKIWVLYQTNQRPEEARRGKHMLSTTTSQRSQPIPSGTDMPRYYLRRGLMCTPPKSCLDIRTSRQQWPYTPTCGRKRKMNPWIS